MSTTPKVKLSDLVGFKLKNVRPLKVKAARSKNSNILVEILKKIVWFLFVPFFTFLTYATSIRPYVFQNIGYYYCGLLDGSLIALIIVIAFIGMMAELNKFSIS
jgi:hypothetical protein